MESASIQALIDEICQNIGGEWLLVGGSLVQLEYDGSRATEDIDLIRIRHQALSDTRTQDELFKAAFRIGLDPERVNSAAKFFVAQIPGWENETIELKRGPKGTVFKPTLTLFIAMKLARGTEIDLNDVEIAIRHEGKSAFIVERFIQIAPDAAQKRFHSLRSRFGL